MVSDRMFPAARLHGSAKSSHAPSAASSAAGGTPTRRQPRATAAHATRMKSAPCSRFLARKPCGWGWGKETIIGFRLPQRPGCCKTAVKIPATRKPRKAAMHTGTNERTRPPGTIPPSPAPARAEPRPRTTRAVCAAGCAPLFPALPYAHRSRPASRSARVRPPGFGPEPSPGFRRDTQPAGAD